MTPPRANTRRGGIALADLFETDAAGAEPRDPSSRRTVGSVSGTECIRDDVDDSACIFIRVPPGAGGVTLELRGQHRVASVVAGGWLLTPAQAEQAAYWVPAAPVARRLDADGHILSEQAAELAAFQADGSGLSVSLAAVAGHVVDLAIWRLPPRVATGLQTLSAIELQPAFLWGSHTRYGKPADVYQHLIHGWVYERGYAWPHRRKICSENDAHALYVTLCGLQLATGKPLYGLLKRQLLLSVHARQGADGGFRHGEWSAKMESHFRLHVSAMHLMMDALCADPGDVTTRAALDRAAAFIAAQTDTLDVGTWFLHDELELDTAGMAAAPFGWVRSRALGKRASNMLVLNTHLDTSVALDRYGRLTGNDRHAAAVTAARAASHAVLALRPAEALYRLIFWMVRLTLLPTERAARLPWWQRAAKRLGWKYLLPRLPDIKVRWPRLVMPGGYVDRELALRTWAYHYQGINLMDLARHQRHLPSADVERVIRDAAAFAHHSGMLQRWAELKYERYALGFWAEALYQLCTLFADADYRTWLAEAMLVLEDLQLGLPPSLLGANAEAVPPAEQLPCPSPADARLRVANLGTREAPELLVVNPSAEPIDLLWESAPPADLRWQRADGNELVGAGALPARTWAWARPPL